VRTESGIVLEGNIGARNGVNMQVPRSSNRDRDIQCHNVRTLKVGAPTIKLGLDLTNREGRPGARTERQ